MNPTPPYQFLSGPLEIIGFANSPTRSAATFAKYEVLTACNLLHTTCSQRYLESRQGAVVEKGDSGGPATFFMNGTQSTVFGVASGTETTPFGSYNKHSPTFDDYGNGNGQFIRQFISDADEDGVNDATDNCTPLKAPQCLTKPWLCVNPNQADEFQVHVI